MRNICVCISLLVSWRRNISVLPRTLVLNKAEKPERAQAGLEQRRLARVLPAPSHQRRKVPAMPKPFPFIPIVDLRQD